MLQFKYIKYFILILFLSHCTNAKDLNKIHIRINQVGYETFDNKSAFVLSNNDLKNERFEIIDEQTQQKVYSGIIITTTSGYAEFKYLYKIDFSDLSDKGTYRIKLKGRYSHKFKIGENLFEHIPKKLLNFFHVQRCGFTNPSLHEPCHGSDSHILISGKDTIRTPHDVTGGWHDAGDYTKFLNTIAYSTYTMLFSYEFNKSYFEFDENKNSVPDILEEAKIGLDWLLRAYRNEGSLVLQVQDLKDHTVGWRLPENDTLRFDRPGYVGLGKNSIGIYTATLALAAKIWKERFSSIDFSNECLTRAENIFSLRNKVNDIDSSTVAYIDNSYKGKLSLGAIELFRLTNQQKFLEIAKEFALDEGPNYWWSYSEISDYTFYRLAEFDSTFTTLIKNSLNHFQNQMNERPFNSAAEFYWGSNHTLLGIALKHILLNKITKTQDSRELAVNQVDYILGKNPWGISFVGGIGSRYSRDLHHQISHILKRRLPGGFAAGPVKKEILENYNIPYESEDKFKVFQTDEAVYRDDRMDYVTNEPTIIANATGIFVFSNISRNFESK
jgi:endoglucanase